ncbi:helix-turn-helix transcriptional regulator [Conexibacter sp. CPCC 206217]|uniref:helix-turn-helix transcriptional regulator n=1 Tax=Conexibacter sp. CPCC 206217 TaxID=3064574 RepID=UPI0027271711|nr:helix-turn-helix transcriptional regulator [Conexibacter sp. CPCC 206217]MDO8213975.1 helix-turn-helix transcriptional regulator [Conexibacter sp. CPCC 206217]
MPSGSSRTDISVNELGAFLRARRARLQPHDVGLTDPSRRRVPGLRRDEVADLAGISESYYSRLEQGQAGVVSDGVLQAVARVLRLTEDERSHLLHLARPATLARRAAKPERVSEATRRLLNGMPDLGAAIVGRRTDVLAWNVLGHQLLAAQLAPDAPDDPERRPNLARLLFLDPHGRDLYVDWSREARDVVSYLRLAVDLHPDDDALRSLIAELTRKDQVFTDLWDEHPVSDCKTDDRELRHPLVGAVTASQQLLRLAEDPGQRLLLLAPAPGESADRVAFLRRLSGG